ncbi:Group 1 glycosyl transferase [Sphingomonas sp. EC-HK361]|uniref:glycosyltransferase family 4 protein n=1 Tax=Sphingomonas sp. EC-HK361 TaxID=2038397 RepID=UPI00125608E9|nr:glycosyltransferase family 4 protein [Sphingomonas sp. EC-HK361]VVT22487.1 Group 1 glycosyl transferase [Sphingomonas sp. EC-HK361]
MLARTSKGRHIAFVLPGLGAGGSEHIVSQLCNHCVASGWTVTLIAFEDPGAHPYYHHDPAVRILPLGLKPERRGAWAAIRAVRARRAILRKAFAVVKPDLVVSFLTRANILSVLAARGMGIPVIVSERNNPALQGVGPIWGALRRWAYPRAAGLVTMTAGAMRYFGDASPPRTWVIANPATIPAGARERHSDGRTIGAVGRFVPQKGFDLLLDAFARVARAVPDWRLVIWGDGPDRVALEAQRARLSLEDRVDMPGITTRPGEWISRSDLFVLSSRFEGWGLVVGEAMAGGLPAVSFDCAWGPAEMIEHGDSGVLVPDGDVDSLADAIIALCRDDARRAALGDAARRRMEAFSPPAIMAQWLAVITEVADQREAAR